MRIAIQSVKCNHNNNLKLCLISQEHYVLHIVEIDTDSDSISQIFYKQNNDLSVCSDRIIMFYIPIKPRLWK